MNIKNIIFSFYHKPLSRLFEITKIKLNVNSALTNVEKLVAVYKEYSFWQKHSFVWRKIKDCAMTTVFSLVLKILK